MYIHEINKLGILVGIHSDEPFVPERNSSEIYIVAEYFKKL